MTAVIKLNNDVIYGFILLFVELPSGGIIGGGAPDTIWGERRDTHTPDAIWEGERRGEK